MNKPYYSKTSEYGAQLHKAALDFEKAANDLKGLYKSFELMIAPSDGSVVAHYAEMSERLSTAEFASDPAGTAAKLIKAEYGVVIGILNSNEAAINQFVATVR